MDRLPDGGSPRERAEVSLQGLLPHVPQSVVREGIERSRELSDDLSTASVARILGSGQQISCQDTVPFTIWCAARYLDDFETAIWETISGGGDRDTTCAIVGGIVACATGLSGIPEIWLIRRETLPSVVKAG
jgi:ADP-ribosylglycohydrolase